MALRTLAVGMVAVLVGMTAGSAVAPLRLSPAPARASGSAPLQVFGGRTEAQAASRGGTKFDSALASIARHLPSVQPDQALASLRSLNPGMRFVQPRGAAEPLVLVDAVTRGDPAQLKTTLVGLGLQHASQFSNDVGGWLPVSQLETASLLAEVHSIRAAMPKTRSGAVTTQGDFVLHADQVRAQNALDGTGITVGILSDSYDCYAEYAKSGSGVPATGPDGYANNGFNTTAAGDMSTGDLPASSKLVIVKDATEVEFNNTVYGCNAFDPTIQLPFGDEGRAMMQIVHDVAPGASIAFYTAEQSEADFASGIVALAAPLGGGSGSNGAGAKIIADDVGYFDEPFFQDGIVAQAINQVVAGGVIYFSAAGNNGETAYDNTAPAFTTVSTTAPTTGEKLLNFGGGATTQSVTIPALIPGEFIAVVVQWDQPFITGAPNSGGSTSSIDLCLTRESGATDSIIDDFSNPLTTGCTGGSTVGQDPVQLLLIGNPASATANTTPEVLNIQVLLKSGTVPGRIKLAIEANGADITYAPKAATMQGHPYAAGAIAVGAVFYYNTPACGTTTPVMEDFSSRGGDPLLFSTTGTRLTTPTARTKPDLAGPDGGNNTFLGFQLSSSNPANSATTAGCKNNTSFPNFLGTSAATPHLAALAALYLQANPAITPVQMLAYMAQDAVQTDKGATFSGAGFVQGDKAATRVPIPDPPAAPVLTLATTSITAGQSTTLTWVSYNDTGCTATGNWTGAMASSGTQTLTPAAAGSYTYTLACSNVAGSSPTGSVTLTVKAAASSGGGGGGGALDLQTLIALTALALIRISGWGRSARR